MKRLLPRLIAAERTLGVGWDGGRVRAGGRKTAQKITFNSAALTHMFSYYLQRGALLNIRRFHMPYALRVPAAAHHAPLAASACASAAAGNFAISTTAFGIAVSRRDSMIILAAAANGGRSR